MAQAFGSAVRALGLAVFASRPLLLALLLLVALLGTSQGGELIASLTVLPPLNNWLLSASALAFAAQTWLWGHIAVQVAFADEIATGSSFENAGPAKLVGLAVPAFYAFSILAIVIYQFASVGRFGLVTLMGVCALGLFTILFVWLWDFDRWQEFAGTDPKHHRSCRAHYSFHCWD